ncbi:MAG: glycosyltransferase [Paludibacter sp.]|nr:glycosyltransferase [Bacteroidales bacterium]MCM1069071.1 glycosyltransferase [Prevotella sp.]MCM1353510.1 glycosyltransferase [Bacteroides sp.]MCM1442671.1 glycosyltransferase [Muribaculum sp.]MCM1481693.1 glycosyltransferase [Paludibacter sp.]
MLLSIITITYNNLSGLQRTSASVKQQSWCDYEWLVIDGGSTDGTVGWLQQQTSAAETFRWLSEPDNGVYDAQNKGIRLAKGDYCFFLNAGDVLCDGNVLQHIFALPAEADVIYGNEIVVDAQGKRVGYARGVEHPSFLDVYRSCMKHQATFIRRSLFTRYGVYDDTLQIVADWEWFFRVIAFHDEVTLLYKDVDVSFFENTGISYHSTERCAAERQIVLNRYMSRRMQHDYSFLATYPYLSRATYKKCWSILLRCANRWAKYIQKKS